MDRRAEWSPDDAGVIDYRAIGNWIKFLIFATRRHKKAVAIVTVTVVALAALGLWVMPKTYEVKTKLLAQRNQVLVLPGEEGQPDKPVTTTASEMIVRRDNLIALVKQTNLLENWALTRPPVLRLKDLITAPLRTHQTEADRMNGMVDFLAKRISAYSEDGGSTLMITINWPDAAMAYRLVDEAQRGFLEARHVQETSTIAESASILEGHAATLRNDIDNAVREIAALRERKRAEKDAGLIPKRAKKEAETGEPVRSTEPPPPPAPDPGVVRRVSELSVMLETKRRDIEQLEGFRQRRLAELQAQLEDKRATYTEVHPEIVGLKQSIAAAARESQQTTKLRGELSALEAEYQQLGGASAANPEVVRRSSGGGALRSRGLPDDVIRIEQTPEEERDPEIEYARSRLKFSIQEYQLLEQKIQHARIDLDTAEAAFKYRYTVVTPPIYPKGPVSPKAVLILIAAAFGGVFLGLISAAVLDLRRGVLRESWQVEQFLALPVITEVERVAELPQP